MQKDLIIVATNSLVASISLAANKIIIEKNKKKGWAFIGGMYALTLGVGAFQFYAAKKATAPTNMANVPPVAPEVEMQQTQV